MLVFMVDAAPAVGSSRFHILDSSSTNNFLLLFYSWSFFLSTFFDLLRPKIKQQILPDKTEFLKMLKIIVKLNFFNFFGCCIVKCQFHWGTISCRSLLKRNCYIFCFWIGCFKVQIRFFFFFYKILYAIT